MLSWSGSAALGGYAGQPVSLGTGMHGAHMLTAVCTWAAGSWWSCWAFQPLLSAAEQEEAQSAAGLDADGRVPEQAAAAVRQSLEGKALGPRTQQV